MLPRITFLSFSFISYDLLTLISVLAGACYLGFSLRRMGATRGQVALFIVLGLIVQDVGGMILPFFYRLIYIPDTLSLARSPGRYFHSILLSFLVFTFFFSKVARWPVRKVLDRVLITALIVSPIGRIGCFMEGCCIGKHTNLPWAVTFPGATVSVHPVQLYMLVLETALLVWLLRVEKNKTKDGETLLKGAFAYSIYRFFIEFVRTNPPFLFGLSHAQVFSLLTAAVLAAWHFTRKKNTALL